MSRANGKKTNNRSSLQVANVELAAGKKSLAKGKVEAFTSPVSISVHSRSYRLRDIDGISPKATIDAIVDLGILADDDDKHVKKIIFTQEKVPKTKSEETIITIEEIS